MSLSPSFPPKPHEMSFLQLPQKNTLTSSSSLKNILLFSSILCVLYLFISVSVTRTSTFSRIGSSSLHVSFSSTSLDHIVFGIAANSNSWHKRKEYLKLWWKPQRMRGCAFLENFPSPKGTGNDNQTLPPICISEDTSRFRYTYKGGYRSAIRVARVVSETIALNHSNVRWYVFGDDDTVFVAENLVKTLSKYDHNLWYYVGTNSETYEQNDFFSFEMAFGGAGFAISSSLAKVFVKVFDSCLARYPHVYGSDARISSCMAELGVGLTHEPGFHQVDVRGDIFGILAAHPLTPLVSLHHLEYADPIFPNMTTNQSLKHLFKAIKADPERILQQTFCYDQWFSWTVLISWGYTVQVFEQNLLLPNLLPVQKTFRPWNKKPKIFSDLFMFNTYELHNDPCRRPTTFFLDTVSSGADGVVTMYKRNVSEMCLQRMGPSKKLEQIRVFSDKMDLDFGQLQSRRRQCCDVLSSSVSNILDVGVRECGEEEMIFMHR